MKKPVRKGKIKLFKKIKKQSTRNKVIAGGSLCVTAAIIIALLMSSSGIVALAGASLPHIEAIASNLRGAGKFNITEVVSSDYDRYFGYYIDGQEPGIGNWRNEIADYNTPSERAAFVDGLRGILDAAGVLGSAPDGGPITWLGDYSEFLPWEDHPDMLQLRLNNEEEAELLGVMVPVVPLPDDPEEPIGEEHIGSYNARYRYEPVEQGKLDEDGNLEESAYLRVEKLQYADSSDEEGNPIHITGRYYFHEDRGLKFSPSTIAWEMVPKLQPVYEYEYEDVYGEDEEGNPIVIGTQIKRDEEGNPITIKDENGDPVQATDPDTGEPLFEQVIDPITGLPEWEDRNIPYYINEAGENVYVSGQSLYSYDEDTEIYTFVGVDDRDPIVEYEDYYYVVVDYGLAAETSNYGDGDYAVTVEHGHADVSGAVVNGARFKSIPDSYVYVGAGNGEFRFIPDEDGDDVLIKYDIVYYGGGFQNNNWFLRHVFNRESSELADYADSIVVTSIRDIDLSDSHIVNADLIVLTAGISLSESDALAIFNASTASGGYKPVMFPRLLGDSAGYEGILARALANKPTDQAPVSAFSDLEYNYDDIELDNGVNDNIFWTTRPVDEMLEEYPYINPIGFEDVKQEIDDENFLRIQQGMSGSDLLDEIIHNGTAIRYIINFSHKRDMVSWETINVLEIQGGLTLANGLTPGAGSFVANESDLTEAKVREWIGDLSGDIVKNINITRMTTYEFTGRIEDLNEKYHMIYIGGSARGMNTADGDTLANGDSRYNDSDMDGLVYTNIGDRYRVAPGWEHGNTLRGLVNTEDDSLGWYRLPGNDISIPKMQDIIDFADAGYPVIIDNRLIDGAGTATIQVTMTNSSSTFSFTSSAPSGSTFRWYSSTASINNVTDSSFTRPANDTTLPGSLGTNHNIYCEITFDEQSVTVGPISIQLSNLYTPGGPQMPTSACPACGTANPNWNGTPGEWLQCNTGLSYDPWYCGLQFNTWEVGATNIGTGNYAAGTYTLPEDAFSSGTNTTIGSINNSVAVGSFANDGSFTESINGQRVDNCSNMYITLNTIRSKPNVYSAASAAESSDNVRRYLNLSKPVIDLHSEPTPYEMTGGVMNSMSGNILRYRFTIENRTEAVPHLTTYDVELFLDLNGDGRYTGFEKQNDIVVRRVSNNSVQSRNGSGRYTLDADVEYEVTKQMPAGAVGLFDWSLRVTKNDHLNPAKRNVRASQSGLTRIAPNPEEITTINILQIASASIPTGPGLDRPMGYKTGQQRVNLEWQQRERTGDQVGNLSALRGKNNGPYFEGVYGKLIDDVDDFNINIYTIYANEITNAGVINLPEERRVANADVFGTKLETYLEESDLDLNSPLTDIFRAFDMLIIGFDDAYGDIPSVAAQAILNFINEGYAVLMAHDVVSHSINPLGGQTNGMGLLPYLRDAVKMDRYGVYNPAHGNTLRNSGYTGLGMIESLLDVGNNYSSAYSVAWKPKSNTNPDIVYGQTVSGTTLRDVQGFGSHPMKWWNHGREGTPSTNVNTNTYNSFMGATAGYEGGWAPSHSENGSYAVSQNREIGFSGSSSSGTGGNLQRVPSRITQVNAGKITTYPYNVNITDFSTPAAFESTRRRTLDVGETHGQWYTINMNLDDIVVWYSLSTNRPDDYRFYIHNDAANAFYIYNSGNVTYTGAGHSMDQGNTTGRNTALGSPHVSGSGTNTFGTHKSDSQSNSISSGIYNEAQLFVNTMIAAYRAAPERPDVMALDATGSNIRYRLLPADEVVLAGEMSSDSDNLAVYFRLLDGNLHADKSISLSLTCASGNHYNANPLRPLDVSGTQEITASALRVTEAGSSNTSNRNGSLLSGVMYKFEIPATVIDSLNSNGRDSEITIRLEIRTTNVPAPYDLVGYADVVVRRIELFNLG